MTRFVGLAFPFEAFRNVGGNGNGGPPHLRHEPEKFFPRETTRQLVNLEDDGVTLLPYDKVLETFRRLLRHTRLSSSTFYLLSSVFCLLSSTF